MRLIATDGMAWYACLSVYVCVTDGREPCKNGWTNQDAVRDMHSWGPNEPHIRWRPGCAHRKEHFRIGVHGSMQNFLIRQDPDSEMLDLARLESWPYPVYHRFWIWSDPIPVGYGWRLANYLRLLTHVDDLPGRWTLRCTNANRLVLPPIKLSTVGSQAFAVVAPHICNRDLHGNGDSGSTAVTAGNPR